MTSGERERITVLCQRISQEKNNQKLAELLQELNKLLDGRRLENTKPKAN
jgi:hypothetical protein